MRRQYNGLGQLLVEQRPDQRWETATDGCGAGSPGQEIDTYYAHDALGRQVRVSAPTLVNRGNSTTRPISWAAGYTATGYDVLGRPSLVTVLNGEVTEYKYVGRSNRTVGKGRNGDPDKVLAWTETNGLGYLARVRAYDKPFEQGGTVYAEVTLSHNVLGNLTGVTHPAGVGATTLTYDFGGRKTGLSDPDLGSWGYSYDRQGKLLTQTDACDNVTTLSYDILQRLTGKSVSKGSHPTCNTANVAYSVSFSYDANHSSGNRSRGQLTQVRYSDNSYQKDLAYTADGLLWSETVKISDGASAGYTTFYGYDQYRRLRFAHLPGQRTGDDLLQSHGSAQPHCLQRGRHAGGWDDPRRRAEQRCGLRPGRAADATALPGRGQPLAHLPLCDLQPAEQRRRAARRPLRGHDHQPAPQPSGDQRLQPAAAGV